MLVWDEGGGSGLGQEVEVMGMCSGGNAAGGGEEGEDGKGMELSSIVRTCSMPETMRTMGRRRETTTAVERQSWSWSWTDPRRGRGPRAVAGVATIRSARSALPYSFRDPAYSHLVCSIHPPLMAGLIRERARCMRHSLVGE